MTHQIGHAFWDVLYWKVAQTKWDGVDGNTIYFYIAAANEVHRVDIAMDNQEQHQNSLKYVLGNIKAKERCAIQINKAAVKSFAFLNYFILIK